MKAIALSSLAAGLLVSFGCLAAAPANAPAGSTGLCKDGSFYSGAEKKGACRGHKGVKDWWGTEAAGKADAKSEAKAEPKPEAKSAAPVADAKVASTRKAPPKAEDIVAKPGGGPGLVWVNASSKVYHCQGDKWYGKTKQGEYMSEADAKAKGFKADHGKACSK